MTKQKLVTVAVTNYYRVPICGDFNPFELDNPQYQGKITPEERRNLENPSLSFLPILAQRQSEIIEVIEQPKASIPYDGQVYNLFENWATIVQQEAQHLGVELDFKSLLQLLIKSAILNFDQVLTIKDEKLNDSVSENQVFQKSIETKQSKAIALKDNEIIFLTGNISSLSLDKDNQQQLNVVLTNGLSYQLQGQEAVNFLNQFDRDSFLPAKSFLQFLDSHPEEESKNLPV